MNTQIHQPIQVLQHHVASLLIYQSVLQDSLGQAFLQLLDALQQGNSLQVSYAYGQWFRAIAAQPLSWPDYLIHQILTADNPFTQQAQSRSIDDLPADLVAAARHDLHGLHQIYRCTPDHIGTWVQVMTGASTPPVSWNPPRSMVMESGAIASIRPMLQTTGDWSTLVEPLAAYYRQAGVGLFGRYRAFRWQAGTLVGIAHPDPIQVDELVGYEWQKQALIQNTEALMAGYQALHVLLYGSRGSGKSSLVKGLLHTYGDRGLRLIEVSKSALADLTMIVEQLRDLPQKFIIFVDDLSFEEDEDAYKALKVVLEGNVTARPQNIVVYATSNRRHLIREFFGDRPRPSDSDEIHAWDTVQEKLSFSDRFGLTLTFEPADQTTYLAIVHHLAQQAQLTIDSSDLDFRALQWATRHNGRSGRTARQFIDFLQAELAL